MIEKFLTLWPEVALLVGAVVCLITGLAPSRGIRQLTAPVAGLALIVAGVLVYTTESSAGLLMGAGVVAFIKLAVVGVGLVLLLVATGVPNSLKQVRDSESAAKFNPSNEMRGEFFAFFLFSLTGVMMTAGADDLVWLFLALELTSLPTYIMVGMGRDHIRAQEAAVKYFFLGALSAAVFLYGFALIYGATGFTDLSSIQLVAQEQLAVGDLSPLLLVGMVLSIVGICFKIAAVPMHFYAADVYEGAATPVTAFLAFVPKTSGFVALILLLGVVGWPLPREIMWLLWGIAALTMTIGNVMGLLQHNVKRVLAYSSVAHSGYIIVGLLAGPAQAGVMSEPLNDGIAAVLFYLVAYGLGTIAAFAVLGCLRAHGEEAQNFEDISGLARRHPALAGVMLISVLSLLGLPPLVGFLGKIYLFVPAYNGGFIWLVIIALLNSAVSAAYYLRIASVTYFGKPSDATEYVSAGPRLAGATIAAAAALVLGVAGAQLVASAHEATRPGLEVTSPMNAVTAGVAGSIAE